MRSRSPSVATGDPALASEVLAAAVGGDARAAVVAPLEEDEALSGVVLDDDSSGNDVVQTLPLLHGVGGPDGAAGGGAGDPDGAEDAGVVLEVAARAGLLDVDRGGFAARGAGLAGRLFFFDGSAVFLARAPVRGSASACGASTMPRAISTHAASFGPRPMPRAFQDACLGGRGRTPSRGDFSLAGPARCGSSLDPRALGR